MISVTIERRSYDYLAFLNGDRNMWGCGRTEAEAIGCALLGHSSNLNRQLVIHSCLEHVVNADDIVLCDHFGCGKLSRASFHYLITNQHAILIADDCDMNKTVTNDIVNVINELSKKLNDMSLPNIDSYRIVYRDTFGKWDGVTTLHGNFCDFAKIQSDDPNDALRFYHTA